MFLNIWKRISVVQNLVIATLVILLLAACGTSTSDNLIPEKLEEEAELATQANQVRFTKPKLVINNFGFVTGGWRISQHPRFMADVNGDNKADIVGFW